MSSSCRSPRPERPRSPGVRALAGTVASSLLVLGLVSACTLRPQEAPVVVPGSTRATTSGSVTATAVPFTMQVYLLRGDRLARVERQVSEGSGIDPALAALALPVSRDEVALGLRTALPATTAPIVGRLTADGAAEINVPPGFDRLSVRAQQEALAQLVFTVTADTIASAVQIVQDGKVRAMPDANGRLLYRPLTRDDFAALSPAS